jgi:serine phosphatase RsbU (regulator of sigma subunit)
VQKRYRAEEALKESEVRLGIMSERNARLRAEHTLLVTEEKLRTARRIQEKLLPDTAPAVNGFDIGGRSCPAEACSGDYFDYVPMPGGRVGIVVADVTGHGLGPALLMAETCAYLRVLAAAGSDVGDILTELNRYLMNDTADDYFITLFLARIDPHDRSFVYASAGHQGYLLDRAGQTQVLEATSLPLGVVHGDVVPSTAPRALDPGQLMLLFTDGIAEATDGNGDCFSAKRALRLVQANRSRPAQECADILCHRALTFSDGAPQRDDMTVLVLKAGYDS